MKMIRIVLSLMHRFITGEVPDGSRGLEWSDLSPPGEAPQCWHVMCDTD